MEINCRITAFITNLILLCAISDAFKLERIKNKVLTCDIIDTNLNTNVTSEVFNLPILLNDTRIKCAPKGTVTNEELMKTIKDFRSQNYEYDFKVIVYDTKDEKIIFDGAIVEKEIFERVLADHRAMTFEIIFTIPTIQEYKVQEILKSIEYKLDRKPEINEVYFENYDLNAVPTRDKIVIEINSPKVTDFGTLEKISEEITETEETTVTAEATEITESSEEKAVTEKTITEKILTEYISRDAREDITLPVTKLEEIVLARNDVPFYTLPIFIAVTTIASIIITIVIVTLCLYRLYAPKIDSPNHNADGPELVNVTRVKTVDNENESNSENNVNSTDDIAQSSSSSSIHR